MSEEFKDAFENESEIPEEITEEVVDETNEPESLQETIYEEYKEDEAIEESGSKKSGGLFSKIKKNIEARREAVGEDDDYDIFDLQEITGITFDESDLMYEGEVVTEPFNGYISVEDVAEVNIGADNSEDDGKKKSIISKILRSSKKEEETEEPVEEYISEEEVIEEPEQDIEEVPAEPEEEYVSPLTKMGSFESETDSALDDINKMLESMGISPIESFGNETKSVKESDIEKSIEEKTQVNPEKTRRIILKKAETPVKKEENQEVEVVLNHDGQLMFDGYVDDEPEDVDEAEIEEKLKSKRKNIVENFHVLSKNAVEDETLLDTETDGTSNIIDDVELRDGEGVFEAVDRVSKHNKSFFGAVRNREMQRLENEHKLSVSEMRKKLFKDKAYLDVRTKIIFVLTVLSGIVSILPAMYVDESSKIAPLFAGGGRIYVLICMFLYALCVLADIKGFINSVRSAIVGNLNSKAVFVFANAIIIMQMLISLVAGVNEQNGFAVYGFVGAMIILAETSGELRNCKSLLQTITTLTKSELRGIQPVESKADSAALGYDLSSDGNPSIYYSTDAKLPENIAGLAKETSFESGLTKNGMIISSAIGLVLSIVVCILNKSAYPFYTVLPCSILLMLPVFRPFVLSTFKGLANKMSIINGVAVLSYDECDEIARANAVVFDAGELLNVNVSSFKKAGKSKISRTDAAVYTAAVLKASDSMLSGCFESTVKERGIEIPEVTDFQYEEGLGFFACVGGVRVIVGNRKCMELHSISCPTEEQEKRYCSDGIVLYTSTQEQIVATFIVRYGARKNIRKQIDAMEKTGLVLMLRCTEPSLNDEVAADVLGCSIAMIKILGSRGNEIIKGERDSLDIYRDNGILCTKKKNSLLYAISAGCGLSTRRKHSRSAQFTISLVWLLMFTFLAIFKVTTGYSAIAIVVFEAIAAALSFFLGKIGNR